MIKIIKAIDALNFRVGRAVMWLAVALALVQFSTVVLRYVFSVGFVPVQESIWYMHGTLFMLGAGFTLMVDGHVRIDIFYRNTSAQRRALIDLLGSVFLLIPVCFATFYFSLGFVSNSWRVLEGSAEVSGLPLIFLLKTVIWIFSVLMMLQGIALALRSWIALSGRGETYCAAADLCRLRGDTVTK